MRSNAVSRGVLLAAVSAVLFGATTPWIERAGRGLGPATTAALLYAGAAGTAVVLRAVSARSGTSLERRDIPRLVGVAFAGAAVAPTSLAWGLPRTGATRWPASWPMRIRSK